MNHGARRVPQDKRDFSFHKTFGSVSVAALPQEFDIDAGFPLRDQNADGLPNGCTGYSQGDLIQDEDKVEIDPKAIYDKTLERQGTPGDYTKGCDMRTSLQVTVDFFGRGGYYNVQPISKDWMYGIRSALFVNQSERRAVSVATPWLQVFETTPTTGPNAGIVPDTFTVPQDWTEGHDWTTPGWVIKNGVQMLRVKSHQGRRVGDNGWLYFSRNVVNKLLSAPDVGAYTVSKKTPAQILTIKKSLMEQVISLMQSLLGLLKANQIGAMSTKAEKLYEVAKSLIGTHVITLDASTDFGKLGCAASVNSVYKKAFGVDIGGGASTADMLPFLKDQTKFEQVTFDQMTPGCIIMCATGTSGIFPTNHGHVGVAGQKWIMSNSSETGTWEANYTIPGWKSYFGDTMGFPILVFKPLD